MSVSQWSCVFTWASSRVAFSWTGDRGRLCRLHTRRPPAFVTIVCMLFFVTSGCHIGRFLWILWPSLLSKVYSQATSCHTRRISKRRRGGRPSSPVSKGNSLVRDFELTCNGPEGKAQPCTPNGGCSLSQDASARLTRSQVAKTDNKLFLFYQQETCTDKVKDSRQCSQTQWWPLHWGMLYFALRKEGERVLLEVNFNLSLPDLIVKEIIIPP